ncbi:hypothetical protein [Vagococcus acidifermentans]|uniref:Uncharacterized protein n=1 Tax=Vagococcus acidifermentans TaxID=564710 RepID=A0A430AY47_9ENTE|nr:hypothetical protein [Vagococcus acidifermentans]RSU12968.1 hypothetical protein CBF27_05370 [Vagococcus acidifermentans]
MAISQNELFVFIRSDDVYRHQLKLLIKKYKLKIIPSAYHFVSSYTNTLAHFKIEDITELKQSFRKFAPFFDSYIDAFATSPTMEESSLLLIFFYGLTMADNYTFDMFEQFLLANHITLLDSRSLYHSLQRLYKQHMKH